LLRKSTDELAKVKQELFMLISSVKNGTCNIQLQDVRKQVQELRDRICQLEQDDKAETTRGHRNSLI